MVARVVRVVAQDPALLVHLGDAQERVLEGAAVAGAAQRHAGQNPARADPQVIVAIARIGRELDSRPDHAHERRGVVHHRAPSEQPVIAHAERGRTQRSQCVPIPVPDRRIRRNVGGERVRMRRALAGFEARVELGVGGVDRVVVPAYPGLPGSLLGSVEQCQMADLGGAELVAGELDAPALQGEPLPARGEGLDVDDARRRVLTERAAEGDQLFAPELELDCAAPVREAGVGGEEAREAFPVRGHPGRGVLLAGARRGVREGMLGAGGHGQRGEARERRVPLLGLPHVGASRAARVIQLDEHEPHILEGAALVRAVPRVLEEHGACAEPDVIDALTRIGRERDLRLERRYQRRRTVERSPADQAVVVPDEIRREQRAHAIPVARLEAAQVVGEPPRGERVLRTLAGIEARVELGVGRVEVVGSKRTYATMRPAASTSVTSRKAISLGPTSASAKTKVERISASRSPRVASTSDSPRALRPSSDFARERDVGVASEVELDHPPAVEAAERLREERLERRPIVRDERRDDGGRRRGRCVREALRRRGLCLQLREARERLPLLIRLVQVGARDRAAQIQLEHGDERNLVATALARALPRSGGKEAARGGADVVAAIDRVGRELDERAEVPHPGFGAARRAEHCEAAVIVLNEGRAAQRGDRIPVATRDRAHELAREAPVRRARVGIEARVELGVGGVFVFEVEGHEHDDAAFGVDLGQAEMLVEGERTAAVCDLGLEARPGQREPLAARREELLAPAARGLVEEHPELRDERVVADLQADDAAPVVHPNHRREHGENAVPITRRPELMHAAVDLSRRRIGEGFRGNFRSVPGQPVEARERLGCALRLEHVGPCYATVRAEHEVIEIDGPVEGCDRVRDRSDACARRPVGLLRRVALVETYDCVAEPVAGEDLACDDPLVRVYLDDDQLLAQPGADVEAPARARARAGRAAREQQRLTERHERLVRHVRVLRAQQSAQSVTSAGQRIARSGRMIGLLEVRAVLRSGRIEIARHARGVEARDRRGRAVRAHGSSEALRLRGAGRQRVEARERLGFAIVLEELVARDAAIGVEDEEPQERPLECAAALATDTRSQPTQEQRLGRERQHVLAARRHVFADLEPGGHHAEHPPRPARRPASDQLVVHDLDVGTQNRRVAVGIEPAGRHHRDRARRRPRSLARGSLRAAARRSARRDARSRRRGGRRRRSPPGAKRPRSSVSISVISSTSLSPNPLQMGFGEPLDRR